tara:strand:- start:4552 stop:5169 length:618 start_codon:yes stop_codon:yes gene_type:complete
MSKFKSVIEKLDLLKSMFADETEVVAEASTSEAEEVTVKFEEAPLMDGSIISFEMLEVGQAVFVITEEGEQVPATEGTLQLGGELEGVSIVLDAEGMILEVIDERSGEEAPAEEVVEEEAMSSESVEAIVDTKMSDIEAPLNAIVSGIESIVERNKTLQNELDTLKADFNSFKNEPTEAKEESKFSTANDKDRRTEYFRKMLNKK